MTPYLERDGVTIYNGDVRAVLAELPAESVHCCVTSPPYWGLRDYGTSRWEGGDVECDHKPSSTPKLRGIASSTLQGGQDSNGHQQEAYRGQCRKCGALRIDNQIGLEETPSGFIETMVDVFREVRRVLREDGTLWLNLGDSYNAYNGGAGPSGKLSRGAQTTQRPKLESGYGLRDKSLKPKDLVGIPWQVALALRADGWYLRSDIIWAKPNPMPESVNDRPTKSHEYLFLLAKSDRYYYDKDAIAEPVTSESGGACFGKVNQDGPGSRRITSEENNRIRAGRKSDAVGVNGRNVQQTNSEATRRDEPGSFSNNHRLRDATGTRNKRSVWTVNPASFKGAHFAVFPHDLIEPCILAGCPEGGTVLDPFFGSGTTGAVAQKHFRKCIGIDLNPDYCKLAAKRFRQRRLLVAQSS